MTFADVDVWRNAEVNWKDYKGQKSIMSRYDALVILFGQKNADKAMRNLEVASWR